LISREEGLKITNEQAKIKQEQRRLEKDKKTFVKTGKNTMPRSEKPHVNRVKEVKKVLTEEQIDIKKYL
jgi:hypothetical protein